MSVQWMIVLNLKLIHISLKVRTEGVNMINIKASYLELDLMISSKSDLFFLNERDIFRQVTYLNALFVN